MKLRIQVGDELATAVLYNNPTSKDFAALLPLTLMLKDYYNTEKVSDLNQRLSTKDAPNGFAGSIGDLTYYAPWGNLALFYKDFGYATGLISLGKITSGMDIFKTKDSLEIRIEVEIQ